MAWPGGKDGAGVYQRLINQIPPHDVFVSAFLGDCAIMRRKAFSRLSIGIDRSRGNIDRWASDPPLANLRLYCCCGIEWLKHAFDLYRVGADLVPSPNLAAIDRLEDAKRLSAGDAGNGGPDRRGVFVYLDPPYIIASRRSRRAIYEHELTEAQHAELLATALQLPCHVMVSHYPHRMYERALGSWRTFTYQAQTRGGRTATEQVWCNYPEPAELHDTRYVGADKRQRERVRKRVRNWTRGLERMGQVERQAILDAIADKWLPATKEEAALN